MTGFAGHGLMKRKVPGWLLLLPVLLGGAVLALANVPRVSESALRSRVERDLPIGTPRADVEAWLGSHGYRYHNRNDRSGRPAGLGGQFSNYYIDLFRPTVIHFEFAFNEEDRTTYISVQESPRIPQLE
jgi:hypothetical protein